MRYRKGVDRNGGKFGGPGRSNGRGNFNQKRFMKKVIFNKK